LLTGKNQAAQLGSYRKFRGGICRLQRFDFVVLLRAQKRRTTVNALAPAIPISTPAVFAGLGSAGVEPQRTPVWPAGDIQDTLVPRISFEDAHLQALGRTIPKDDVGGDLVDLIQTGQDVTVYVADVSGHGLRAAFLMGMIKTAVRYGLRLGQSLAKLLDHMNCVLPAVKQPHMFATLAALRFDGSSEVEYISAGHVPLLHYRRRQGDVVRYSMQQFPLGLFADDTYVSRRVGYEPGDIFLLVTDGVVEAGEDRDADSGFEQLARILGDRSGAPLAQIVEAVQALVAGMGAQHDDQTVLLVRACG
jgi:sigma-B regulation protein RsbU (phosphoserine phosphatase)